MAKGLSVWSTWYYMVMYMMVKASSVDPHREMDKVLTAYSYWCYASDNHNIEDLKRAITWLEQVSILQKDRDKMIDVLERTAQVIKSGDCEIIDDIISDVEGMFQHFIMKCGYVLYNMLIQMKRHVR